MHRVFCSLLLSVLAALANAAAAEAPSAEALDYFEQHIRPVLVENCYECHGGNPDAIKSGLNLTYRGGVLKGGKKGPAFAPGAPDTSRLLNALRYENEDLRMPPAGKLADDVIARFETWIRMGAPDPRDEPPSTEALTDAMSWESIRERRMAWWSFQPVHAVRPPDAVPAEWAKNPVDAFIWTRMQAAGLAPSDLADPYALVRRLYFVLTGLPPTPEQVAAFVAAEAADHDAAVAATADGLLASPAFGECWGRHWLDWMRYAETHGSEGDPAIPFAWRYRDYIIRAINADVPYDDLVREQLAGDRLADPRINPDTGVNESMIGTAQYRFVLHGFAPTDPLDERVRFTDNQIDVVSKAFLGVTVTCARCHDHKFDPISQKDYYALFGIMASNRPATLTVDTPERQNLNKAAIAATKEQLRALLAQHWLDAIEQLPDAMKRAEGAWGPALANATTNQNPLHPWQRLRLADPPAVEQGWRELDAQWTGSQANLRQRQETPYPLHWDLGGEDANTWLHQGSGLDGTAAPAGSFDIRDEGEPIIRGIYPAGVYSHLYSTKHSGVFESPHFDLKEKQIYVRIAGDGDAVQRYAVQDYPRDGTVYPVARLQGGDWRWQRWDVAYWNGDSAHLEISTANDQAVLAKSEPKRSWFGITEAVIVGEGQPVPRDEMAEFVAPLFAQDGSPKNSDEVIARYQNALRQCVSAWRDGAMDGGQARFLNHFAQHGLLPNTVAEAPETAALVAEYRRLESEIPYPTRAPGILEGAPVDQPLFARGNHKQPLEPVRRRFLEAIDDRPYDVPDAGRPALAESILDESDPLAARVIANRLWRHTFGRGIVATPDNFGVMGAMPTHPELLDYLAARMREKGWSMKTMIRLLVTSRTFQLSAVPSAEAREQDPGNTLWSHAMVRRLDAEAIRDAMLAASGRLEMQRGGEPVDGGANRRSVYVRVIRNNLDPFLTTFDAPTPVSTTGRRDSTNVPAHALAFMNDPFVRSNATALASRVASDPALHDPVARAGRLFELAIGRPPTDYEREQLLSYAEAAGARLPGRALDPALNDEMGGIEQRLAAIDAGLAEKLTAALAENPELAKKSKDNQLEHAAPELVKERNALQARLGPLARLGAPPEPWAELAQSLFSLKEFIYLR